MKGKNNPVNEPTLSEIIMLTRMKNIMIGTDFVLNTKIGT